MANIPKEKKEKNSFKLKCVITGKTTTIVKSYYEKKVAEFGSDENLQKYYTCKQAKSMLKRGYSVAEIQDTLGTTGDIDTISPETIAAIIKLHESDEIPFSTSMEPVNSISVRPEVQLFINKLKAYERLHSNA